MIREKEDHYIIMRDFILQEDVTILNMYTLNNTVSQYTRKKMTEMQGEIDKSTTWLETLTPFFQ